MNELISQLVQQLGIGEDQAKGGAGLLLKLAKDKLGGDFSQITDAIGNVDELIGAAPDAGGLAKLAGGLASKLGGGDAIGNLASLAGGFKNIGLDTDMISKFVSSILEFVKGKGGDNISSLLQKALA